MKTSLTILATLCASQAAALTITGYDITDALVSGWGGGFNYTYDGTVGPVISYYADGVTPFTVDLTGGGGTLNDGNIATNPRLGMNAILHDGANRAPTITLYFDQAYYLTELSLFGGDYFTNGLMGNVGTMTVTGGGVSQDMTTVAFGPERFDGKPVNDRLAFAGTALADMAVSSVTLSHFVDDDGLPTIFSLTEITGTGTTTTPVASVPVPPALPLAALGIVALAGLRRKPAA